jgi:hypothetical protein
VRAATEQAGELDDLIADLLNLARYGEAAPHREVVRLDLLTADVVNRRQRQSLEVTVQADLEPCLGEHRSGCRRSGHRKSRRQRHQMESAGGGQ